MRGNMVLTVGVVVIKLTLCYVAHIMIERLVTWMIGKHRKWS